jgi:hypothetical protein
MSEARIDWNDSALDVATKMAGGNPGALSVLTRSFLQSEKIDPANAFGQFGMAVLLDQVEMYGPNIWVLYKDVADSNLATLHGILRAVQLGFSSPKELREMLKTGITAERKQDLLDSVQKCLPDFQLQPE